MSSKMSKICDKSVFVICRPINTHYCPSRGCTLQHNLHSVFSQRPCSPDTYFAMQCYSRVHYFALYFSCIFNLKRIGSQVNEDDDFHNLSMAWNQIQRGKMKTRVEQWAEAESIRQMAKDQDNNVENPQYSGELAGVCAPHLLATA